MSKTFHKLVHISRSCVRPTNILTREHVEAILNTSTATRLSYVVNSHSKTIFFTTHHGFGHPHMPSGFVPITCSTPGEAGTTIEQFLGMQHSHYTVIDSIQQLAPVMDKFYPEFGNVKQPSEVNWQPEHFPTGTVVELKNYYRDPETGNMVHSSREGTLKPAWVTVSSVVKNGIDSYCIVTDAKSPEQTGGFDTYHFDHVGRVLARGEGDVVWDDYKREQYFEKNMFTRSKLKRDHYYWADVRILIPHILSSIPGAKNKLLKDSYINDIYKQSFVKTLVIFDGYSVKHASKKKLREFVRKNWNRWIMPAKEVREEQRKYDLEMERLYYQDMEAEFDRDLIAGKPFDDVAESSEETQDSEDHDHDRPEILYIGVSLDMPAAEQVQADVAYLANKGNANGY